MSLFPLGLISQGGGGAGGNALTLISTQVLASSASSVTFSSIPSTYKHLQLRMVVKTSSDDGGYRMRFNTDTGSNYRSHRLAGYGAGIYSEGSASTTYFSEYLNSSAVTNMYGAAILDILDYSTSSKNRVIKALSGRTDTNGSQVTLSSGVWLNTATVSTIDLISVSTFSVGSRFSLYGVS